MVGKKVSSLTLNFYFLLCNFCLPWLAKNCVCWSLLCADWSSVAWFASSKSISKIHLTFDFAKQNHWEFEFLIWRCSLKKRSRGVDCLSWLGGHDKQSQPLVVRFPLPWNFAKNRNFRFFLRRFSDFSSKSFPDFVKSIALRHELKLLICSDEKPHSGR